jgi:hypothetical protein
MIIDDEKVYLKLTISDLDLLLKVKILSMNRVGLNKGKIEGSYGVGP